MRLMLIDVNKVLGLQGTVDFAKNPVLLYGRNLAGKTNIINLIRYCFVSGKAGKKYSEEKRLDKNEMLLDEPRDGNATFYFEHKSKLYKLEYIFKRSSKSTSQKIILSAPIASTSLDEHVQDSATRIQWKPIAEGVRKLKEKFAELGIYSDVIDLLISPSNVRNFTDAINNELVTVPDIIAKQVSQVHNGAAKLLGNLEKLHNVLILERENYTGKLGNLRAGYQRQSSKTPEETMQIFVLGYTYDNLDRELREVDKLLSELPTQETQLKLFKQRWATEFKEKFQKIASAKKAVNEKEDVDKLREKDVALTDSLRLVQEWNATFKVLPSKDNVQALTDFDVPSPKPSDFEHLLNPERIRKIFDLLDQAKLNLQTSREIAKKYRVTLALGEVRSLASSYRKLSRAMKSPEEKPKGDDAVIYYSEDEKESAVYVPIEVLISNPNYLRGIKSTPSVYRTKKLGKKELEKLLKEIERKVGDLEACRDKLGSASDNLDEAKKLVPLLNNEVNHLDQAKQQTSRVLQERLQTWQTAAAVLVDAFNLKRLKIELGTIGGIEKFVSWLSDILERVESEFVEDFKNAIKSAGIRIGTEFKIEDIDNLDELIAKQSKEIVEKRERLQSVRDWITANLNEVRIVEDQLMAIGYTEAVISTLDEILKQIQDYTNLETMSEQIAQNIEENVKRCVEMILPEEKVRFRHVGQGKFLIEAANGEPVTHPAGSHKAVISLGIMVTLAKLFDVPLILDEATDRFDYITLRNTFQYADILSKDDMHPQICFVSYRTLNIEKDPETLNIVKNWNTYIVERHADLKTITKAKDIVTILQ